MTEEDHTVTPITHGCQIVARKFINRLAGFSYFCELAHKHFEARVIDLNLRQIAARQRDAETYGALKAICLITIVRKLNSDSHLRTAK